MMMMMMMKGEPVCMFVLFSEQEDECVLKWKKSNHTEDVKMWQSFQGAQLISVVESNFNK